VDQTSLQGTLTFPGRYASLEAIREFVVTAAQEAGLSPKSIYAIDLAVDEACTNIIEHAYGGENRGKIECTIQVSRDKITITLRDYGKPFDPTNVPHPEFGVPLEKLKTRGAGLYLMKNMMDEIHYESQKKRGNLMRLVKLIK
jgi:serine/threonine-protein kinase RsbW